MLETVCGKGRSFGPTGCVHLARRRGRSKFYERVLHDTIGRRSGSFVSSFLSMVNVSVRFRPTVSTVSLQRGGE